MYDAFKRITANALAALVMTLFSVQPVFGETASHEPASGHERTHTYHPNSMAVFVGVTHEGSESGASLAIEYERRLSKSFGVGVVVERTFGNLDFWLYAVPFAYHSGRWKFYVAPGVADGKHGSESLLRIGAEYAFDFGDWELSPQINGDFVDDNEAVVLGFTIGRGFGQ